MLLVSDVDAATPLEGILSRNERVRARPPHQTNTMTDMASHDSRSLVKRVPALAAHHRWRPWAVAASMLALVQGAAWAEDKPVFRCPGNLYTDALTAKEAQDKGCKTLEGAPITVIQSVVPRSSGGGSMSRSGTSSGGERVPVEDQKARDSDARRILEAELKKEEDTLAGLQKEFNSGQPERLGDERNYQKYTDRVNEMKAAITRKEADVAALKRELGKFGSNK